MMRSFRTPLVTALIMVTLVGCATLQQQDLPPEEDWLAFEPPRVEIDYDVFQLRIDLSLRVHNRAAPGICPGSFLGVNLGNGLFVDGSGDLSLNLVKLLKLNNKDFRITEGGDGWLWQNRIYTRTGNLISIKPAGLFSWTYPSYEIELNTDGARVEMSPRYPPTGNIIVEKDRITHDFDASDRYQTVVRTAFGARFSSSGHSGCRKPAEIELRQDGAIQFHDGAVLERDASRLNKLTLCWPRSYPWWSAFSPGCFTLVRSNDRIAFYNEGMRGVVVELGETNVRVTDLMYVNVANRRTINFQIEQ